MAGMVGDAFLAATLQVTLDRLASPILQTFGQWSDVHKDLSKLTRTLSMIQAVLNDAEQKQISNSAVQMWLIELRHVAFDIEDLLDEVEIEALQVPNISFLPKHLMFEAELPSKIKDITDRLHEIANLIDEFGLREEVGAIRNVFRERSRETSSLIEESRVFGRVEDKKKIVESLVSDDHSGISVILLVGMGGVGKTTLAQLVYNDERVVNHFELRMWVCVSDDFDVRKITKSIIESATEETSDHSVLDVLQRRLQKILKGKRFLLLLDDVWTEKKRDWETVSLPFSVGAEGSKIIITTRSLKVSSMIMGKTMTHLLEGLSEDDCWSLFKQKAFADGKPEEHPNLVVIGKEIVKKCKGLPLAAKTLGGLLYSKFEEDEWDIVLKSEIWDLDEDENDILPALRLSYNHLPTYLRQCFAYCSIFPKGFVFEKEKLVLMWIAAGFVHSKGRKSMEDVGHEYFNDLLLRSFFQNHDYDFDMSRFIMHDLMHELAQGVSREICFTMEVEKRCNTSKKAQHASLLLHMLKSATFETFPFLRSLRTCLLRNGHDHHQCTNLKVALDFIMTLTCLRTLDLSYIPVNELPAAIGNLKHLRYLDLTKTHIVGLPESTFKIYSLQILILRDCLKLVELPDTIGNMKNLRYLDLTNTYIVRLPESTSSLCNLQKLILKGCRALVGLPKGTRNLVNLRHLNLNGCFSLVSMPHGVGGLTCLQTFNRFIVSKDSGCGGIEELKHMMHLRGHLFIKGLDLVNSMEAKEAHLNDKCHLQKLILEWSSRSYSPDGSDEGVLEGLQPPTGLKDLNIYGYHGITFPSWVGDSSFSCLVEITLFDCKHCKILPPLGQLPVLKHLRVHAMDGLEHVGRGFCGVGKVKGFPSLESLEFRDMWSLKDWNEVEDGEFPCLGKLVIKNCPKMTTLPIFPSLCDLYLRKCHEMILSQLPYLTSLSSLKIYFFERLATLQLQELVSLLDLEIFCCPKLISFQGHRLPIALRQFRVSECHSLESLPMGLQDLSSLEKLKIFRCSQLVSFPVPTELKTLQISECENLQLLPRGLQCLTSLEVLSIRECSRLECLPEEGLPTGLKHLEISFCENLQSVPTWWLQCLTSLERLEIGGFSQLECLSEGSLPYGLKHLEISYCENLQYFPMELQCFTSLESLEIGGCSRLKCLPEEGLPTQLRFLVISGCDLLEKRCKAGGEDWSKIAHIPVVCVNGQLVKCSDDVSNKA